jgi:hypothetical protein
MQWLPVILLPVLYIMGAKRYLAVDRDELINGKPGSQSNVASYRGY